MKYKLDNKNTTYTKEKTHFIKETTQGKSSHKSNEENTPYDDAGKTLLHDCPAFVIPLINEIFEKKLLVLLPFYLFWYTDNLDEIEKDEEKFQKLKCEYERIKIELELLHKRKELTLYEKKTIISMTKKVVRNLTTKYPKIQKGVNEIMGGQVLMHEAKALTEKGIRIGMERGIEMEKQNTEIEKKRADEAVKEVLMLREFIKSNGFTLDF